MYNKLPLKERIELMKSYRKANKDMSYRDMVNDYNDSYQKFRNGGDTSLTNIEGHYSFGGQNTKTHTHMAEGGWLDNYQTKGEVKPKKVSTSTNYYTSDPIDYKNRLNAYNDSLSNYKKGVVDKNAYMKFLHDKKIDDTIFEKKDWDDVMEKWVPNKHYRTYTDYMGETSDGKPSNFIAWNNLNHEKYDDVTGKPFPITESDYQFINKVEHDYIEKGYYTPPAPTQKINLYSDFKGKDFNKKTGPPIVPKSQRRGIQKIGLNIHKPGVNKFGFKYGGIQQFSNGGKLSYPQKMQAYNDSTILYNSGFNKNIPNPVYEPQFNAAKQRLTLLNNEEPQSTDKRPITTNPDYLQKRSVPYAKPTLPIPPKNNTSLGISKNDRTPIYTSDKNDPRLRAYNDSLATYNLSNKAEKLFNKNSSDPQLQVYNQMADKVAKRTNIKPVTIKTNSSEFTAKGFDPMSMQEEWMAKFKKPVQPYIYKKPEEKEQSRTDVYTDKALYDKAYKAEMDSINVRKKTDQTFNPRNKTRPLTNKEKEDWKDEKTGLYPNLVEYNSGQRYFGHFKKPVVHNVYQPFPPPEEKPIKDTIPYSSKPKLINSDTIRHWNFNGPNPVMEYYDKSGKLINKEYYTGVNGKKIQPLTR